jgi:hypothetical protein
MIPLFIYALVAAGGSWALHKRRWGWLFFSCAMMLWLILMQCINAYFLHGSIN